MKIKSNSTLLTVGIAVMTILLSGHALQTIIPSLEYVLVLTGAVSAALVVIQFSRKKANEAYCLLLLFGVMIFCTTIVHGGRDLAYYVKLYCMILTAFVITECYSFHQTMCLYRRIMMFVTVISLIGYTLLQTTTLMDKLPTLTNVNDQKYAIGIIFNYLTAVRNRNCGMFWEPGVFASHLIIACVYEILYPGKRHWLVLLVFSLALFTANSSAGFVLWFLCVVLMALKKNEHRNPVVGYVISTVGILVAVGVVISFDKILELTVLGENEFFQKLTAESIAASERNKAIVHNLEIFISEPLFGAGYSTVSEMMKYVADTSTSTLFLSMFGVLGSLYTIAWGYGVLRIRQLNLMAKIVLLLIFMIIVNKEPHRMILFTWYILFYFVKGVSPLTQSDDVETAITVENESDGREYGF